MPLSSYETASGPVFKLCALIPCYNHGKTLGAVIGALTAMNIDCIIADDGSDTETQADIAAVQTAFPCCRVFRLAENSGKGGALEAGFRRAAEWGYTHALQVDADGQHDLSAVPALLKMAEETPDKLISGQPVYDKSVPKSRLYGRYITHAWVWIETLSLSLKDSMCGFRVYPLTATLAVMDKVRVGRRMDFDTEIMVRLYWDGTDSRFLPVQVYYPHAGISHFDTVKDNVRISKMHTRLFFGMLPRLPQLLKRKPAIHWAASAERRGATGMRFMIRVFTLFGRKPFQFLLFFVAAVFWLTGGKQRRASLDYLANIRARCRALNMPVPGGLNSYRHFLRFGGAMLDKVAGWSGKLTWGRDVVFAPGAADVLNAPSPGGKLILASHLGDIEVCRALAETGMIKRINALVFREHAALFQKVMAEVAPQSLLNLISVADITPGVAIMLQDKIRAGEWVAIVGDRIALSGSQQNTRRITLSPFLGEAAPFPQGPFILASLLKCPVVLMFALKEQGKLVIHSEAFAEQVVLPRKNREEALQHYISHYAVRLEYHTLRSPLDWFNFYPFWQLPADPASEEKKHHVI